MLLPEGHGLYPGHPKLHGYVRFFHLDTGAFVRVHIPLFEDHCVLDSFQGLLVLQRDDDTAVRLLHPFTGDIVDLPPLSTLLPQMHQYPSGERSARRKILYLRSISTAATFTDDGVVAVMLAFTKRIDRVAFATSQDHQWTMSTWSYPIRRSPAPFSYHGKTYVVNVDRMEHTYSIVKIFQIDTPLPGELLQPPKLIATCDTLWPRVCMVECNSEVLVIGHSDTLCSKQLVYKLADLVMGRCIPVTCIGDNAIVSLKRTLSASAKALPMLEAGTIIRYNPTRYCLMKYHLSSGSWSPAMDPCSLDGMEAGPCSFAQHMVTCCSCTHWYVYIGVRLLFVSLWLTFFCLIV
jgi:hypothetical protein